MDLVDGDAQDGGNGDVDIGEDIVEGEVAVEVIYIFKFQDV